jgi:phage-related baseplate assembly protein
VITNNAINLSQLPLPAAVEVIDFEVILAALKADLILRAPEIASVLNLESEPLVKLLEVFAFREMILRARINDGVRAVHLATATGADLEHLAALFGVVRLTVAPANPTATPPTAAVMESDTNLRLRAQLALEGFSTAGPRAAYEFHARSSDARVLDIHVDSPDPGNVRVVVLSSEGNGTASAEVLTAVSDALNAEDVRPLCDTVTVQSAVIVPFAITAELVVQDGPDPAIVLALAQNAVASYLANARRISEYIRLSAIYAALHQPGVEAVVLALPVADIAVSATQAATCTAVNVTLGAGI